ncbi:TRAP transporter small permease subunit [Desulfatitalea alkaliphila]|uniref:TRAP transporter small permease subunit n=1 Tax=Desulfatitalea alkaliphila TaxID=2929485 RepID=A0AA41R3W3_9BACT|nr:TRAP transporter small permease subunit [Desulfatitalea alkaliphila]MCJ8500868.1 TRAP transporter small permease subunit [Desulfatitalea alkaliphila]
MRMLIRIISKISDATGFLLMWLPWFLMVIIVWEVIARSLFNHPTVWAHELSIMVFAALTILSGAYTLRTRSHVNMDLLYMQLSIRKRALLDVLTFPFFLVFCGVILWLGWEFAWRSVQMGEISQSDWAPPIWPIKLTIPLGAILLLLQGIANFLADLIKLVTGREVTE